MIFASNVCASEKQALAQNTNIDEIKTDRLCLRKTGFLSGFSDAKHMIDIVSEYEVSRCIFGAEATQEFINDLKNSWFQTKIFVPFMFLIPGRLKGLYRWMINKDTISAQGEKKNEVNGTVTLETISKPEIVEFIKKHDPQDHQNYMNLSILLKKADWNKGYAKESITALFSRVLATNQFKHLKGLILMTTPENDRSLNCLMEDEHSARKPLVYHGDITMPKGLNKYMPKECVLKCFMLTKEDFLKQNHD